MITNSYSDTVADIQWNLSTECSTAVGSDAYNCLMGGLGLFAQKVKQGGEWDHKEFILSMANMRGRGDVFTPIPGTDWKISYEFYSNMHFGYVGTEAGIDAEMLQFGSDLADLVDSGERSPGDQVSVQLGINLREKVGPDRLTSEMIFQEIIESAPALLQTGVIIPR